jgi:sugar lactone lactonase YvrE
LGLGVLFFPVFAIAQPVRGLPGDFWADVVLGQTDFSQMTFNEATAKRLARPGGAFVDRTSTPNRLYVYDAGNNRILGFSDIGVLSPNQATTGGTSWAPDIVLGQQDYTHTAANGDSQLQDFPGFNFASYLSSTDPLPDPTASTLCLLDPRVVSPGESGSGATLAVDAEGNLYVPDYYNNRVLRYDAPTYTGEAAGHEWGQPDFSSYRPNQGGSPTNATLSFMNQRGFLTAGVAIDAWGNLWVTDTGNQRVLRFPNPNAPSPGIPSSSADVILGQTGVAATNDLDLGHFYYPGSVRVDPSGVVFVADGPPASNPAKTQGGRVLIFKPASVNGMGVPQYSNGQLPDGSVTYGLVWPTGLEFDPSGDLWVNDFGDDQMIQYHMDLSAVPPTGTPVKLLLRSQLYSGAGTPVDPATSDNADFYYSYPPSSVMSADSPEYHHDNGGGLGVDSAGDVFAVFSDPVIDCMRYPAPIPALIPTGGVTATDLPGAPTEAHAPDIAVFKSGQDPDTGGINNVITGSSVDALGLAVGYSAAATQLIASEYHRLDYWNLDTAHEPSAGLSDGKTADGFAGTTPSTVDYLAGENFGRICTDQAAGQPHLWAIHGDGNNLWVEVYNLPLTPWQGASITLNLPMPVLGGGSFNCGLAGNRRMDGIAVDPTGNYLWLSDTSNNRVFRVRNALGVSPGPTPVVDIILGQSGAAATLANMGGVEGADTLNQPGAVTYDHHGNLYVSDFSLETNGNGPPSVATTCLPPTSTPKTAISTAAAWVSATPA